RSQHGIVDVGEVDLAGGGRDLGRSRDRSRRADGGGGRLGGRSGRWLGRRRGSWRSRGRLLLSERGARDQGQRKGPGQAAGFHARIDSENPLRRKGAIARRSTFQRELDQLSSV